ncbi:Inner membrane symporter yicJ [Salmonella enterica subsp. enterica serovar Typhimurium]|nr:Inner membrane symporter yicJ [Salmonella enterica subsp. enterica serovar Typhimurium]
MKSEILSVKEKIGYGMGDAASHIIFDNVMLYMMFFYTDIFGIPAGFVGTMFLLARALDAISDLVWACWPTAPALAGQIPTLGAVWRVAVWYRLCAGL